MTNTILQKLWTIAEMEVKKHSAKPTHVFGEIGLYLEMPPANWGFYPTPINTSTFASTHNDRVHYSLLHINGEISEHSPVVMTVPCNFDNPNLVLGENLLEFLCLGCEAGYRGLDSLAYLGNDTMEFLKPHTRDYGGWDAEDYRLLDVLTQAFSLRPWEHLQRRLRQLRDQYHGLLDIQVLRSFDVDDYVAAIPFRKITSVEEFKVNTDYLIRGIERLREIKAYFPRNPNPARWDGSIEDYVFAISKFDDFLPSQDDSYTIKKFGSRHIPDHNYSLSFDCWESYQFSLVSDLRRINWHLWRRIPAEMRPPEPRDLGSYLTAFFEFEEKSIEQNEGEKAAQISYVETGMSSSEGRTEIQQYLREQARADRDE